MTDVPHDAHFSFAYDDTARAEIVERSVGREVGEIDDDRSTARLGRRGATVEIEILADDLVALRAASNTWCSLVDVAERATHLSNTTE